MTILKRSAQLFSDYWGTVKALVTQFDGRIGASIGVDANRVIVEIRKSFQWAYALASDLYTYDVVVKKLTFAVSSPDEFLY